MSNCTILVQVLCIIYQIPLETVVEEKEDSLDSMDWFCSQGKSISNLWEIFVTVFENVAYFLQ